MSDPTPHRSFGLAHFIAFVAGVVFFVLSFVLLAIIPGRRLEDAMVRDAPVGDTTYTALEARGRDIYAREGCAYCHTEQVRGTVADVERWGPATAAWETRNDYPQVWGTRRIGPDLGREGGVRSDDWQLTHLYNPRWVVPGSVMPAYPWLFANGATRPNEDGRAVLAYMQSLGRPMRELHGSVAFCPRPGIKSAVIDARSSGAKAAAPETSDPAGKIFIEDGMAMGGAIDANAAIRRLDAPYPALATAASDPAHTVAGRAVFETYCAGCHGTKGAGDGPAAASLLPRPANLRLATYSDAALGSILWNGRPGTSMPAWRDLSETERADVATFVRSLHVADPPPDPAPDPKARDTLLARGATVYAENCIACHGVDGRGNGPVAHVFAPRPANFTAIRPNEARVLQALAEGVPGASMPVFSGLGVGDQRAVAAYVGTLYGRKAQGP